ncbi:TetR family transcriptional regulator [Humibacillus xanthopallidus]|uniref:TetR family transcriptional regulator n=1 Tax=Humibacillus xanthopallidus TaxID=412689 RepID=A0A543PK72_9MICO|nr:TetR/AcrR family transcriptional regulator [Humibacillus xanthopallidus]TQN44478.1 TetR family transcriptional regulator [Humibacillus xanthopallidus]
MTADASTAPPPGKRARNRAAVEAEILVVARRHLATEGAAALSLRAIARDLGMVSSGIYRYVESRDELLTRLIVDSYRSSAQAVRSAHDVVPADDLAGRWRAIGHGLRTWALRHPHDFTLLYGSPVPDYEAPADRTGEPGTAVLAILVTLVVDTRDAGRLADPDQLGLGVDSTATNDTRHQAVAAGPAVDLDAAVGPFLRDPMFASTGLDPAALAQGLCAWTLLLGAVTSEIFGQLGPVPDPDALFEVLLTAAGSTILSANGLPPTSP